MAEPKIPLWSLEEAQDQQLRGQSLGTLLTKGVALMRQESRTMDDLAAYRSLGNLLIKNGEPLSAVELIEAGCRAFPYDRRLRQLLRPGVGRERCCRARQHDPRHALP